MFRMLLKIHDPFYLFFSSKPCVQNVQKATNVFAQKHSVSRDKRGAVLGNEGAGFRYSHN